MDKLSSQIEESLCLSDIEATWLACAIDTDGHATIKRTKSKVKGRCYTNYLPQIGFHNNHREITGYFGELIDAKIQPSGITWQVYTNSTRKILIILQYCLPYLIIKKTRAEFIIDYCRFRLLNPGDHSTKSSRVNEDREWCKEFRRLFPPRNRRPLL